MIGISASFMVADLYAVSFSRDPDNDVARCEFVAERATLTYAAPDSIVRTLELRDVKLDGRWFFDQRALYDALTNPLQ